MWSNNGLRMWSKNGLRKLKMFARNGRVNDYVKMTAS
jgi:hypothetical protein